MTPKVVATESLQNGKVIAECVCVREKKQRERETEIATEKQRNRESKI